MRDKIGKRLYIIKGPRKNFVTVSWDNHENQIRFYYNEALIGSVEDINELEAGHSFQINDDSKIDVQLDHRRFRSPFFIALDGKKIPESWASPVKELSWIFGYLFFAGVVHIMLSILLVFDIDWFAPSYYKEAIDPLPNGVTLLILSFCIYVRYIPALIIWAVLSILLAIATLIVMASNGDKWGGPLLS